MNQAAYPVQFSVDYPDRPLDRVKTLVRPVLAIPILLVLGAVSGATTFWTSADGTTAAAGAGGLLFAGPLLMIVVRRKYPRWWFDWNLELQRFCNWVPAYLALMDDRYPFPGCGGDGARGVGAGRRRRSAPPRATLRTTSPCSLSNRSGQGRGRAPGHIP